MPEKLSSTVRARLRLRLEGHPIAKSLSPTGLDRAFSRGLLTTFSPGEHLSREGDEARFYWLLLEGSVRVYYRSAEGLEVTVKIFSAPAAWAEMQILTRHCHTEDCVCVERAWCLCLPAAQFQQLLDDEPAFMRLVLEDTSARFLIAAQNERALAFLTVPERLAHLLLSYVRVYGRDVDGTVLLDTRVSHEQLAADLGVVKKSVTRALSLWASEGVLKKVGQSYAITDLGALVERAPKGLIGVDWTTGTAVRDRLVDDDDLVKPRR